MKKITALLLALMLSVASYAQSTSADFNNLGVIDYHTFIQLPKNEQRQYLKLIMETIVALEAAVHAKGDNQIYPPEQVKKMKKTVQLWNELIRQLTVSDAYARAGKAAPKLKTVGHCVYAGWFSTFVDTENYSQTDQSFPQRHCQHPRNSKSPEVRSSYQAAVQHCSEGTLACNPEAFGYNTATNKPDCVNVNQLTPHNASLACLMAAQSDPEPEKRLDNMVDRLKNEANCAEAFNRVIQAIFNTCVCQKNPGQNAGGGLNVRLAEDYFSYMSGHRTCYALVGQTQRIAQRMSARKADLRSCWLINPENVDILANDLSFITNYTDRVSGLAIESDRGDYKATLRRYTKSNETALDHLPDYDKCLGKLRVLNNPEDPKFAEYANATCNVGGTNIENMKGLCPIVIPPVADRECSVTVTPGEASADGVAFTANLALTPALASGEANAATVAWKLNGADVAGETGMSLSGKAPAAEGNANESQLKLSAVITHGTKTYSCSYDNKITAQNDGCLVTLSNSSFDAATRKATATATITPAGGEAFPEGAYDSIEWKLNDAEAGVAGELVQTVEKVGGAEDASVKLTAKATLIKGEARKECTAGETEVTATRTPDAVTCEISTPNYDAAAKTLKANVTFANLPEGTSADATKVKWTFPGGTKEGVTSLDETNVTIADVASAKVEVAYTIPASADGVEPSVVNCSKNLPAPTVAEKKACVLALNKVAVANEFDISATVSGGQVKEGQKVTFAATGLTFTVNGMGASSKIKAVKEKKTYEVTASFKGRDDKDYECKKSVEIPAEVAASAPGAGMPQQQGVGPGMAMPDIFIEGVR